MSRWTPCKRIEFIRRLRAMGFAGPYAGGRHHFLIFQDRRLAIPSKVEYSVAQLRMLLREAEGIMKRSIELDEWEELS